MKLSPNTAPIEPDNLLIRMHNQVGAAVDVTGTEDRARWACHGCGDVHSYSSIYLAREDANVHATTCRAAYHRLR
ncbi:hypothetical protein ADK91_08135 [Streptomyces sp. XY511]|uniref:hypothetical protein n=1 Tax=Streptomyces sp. XY511 TaxID=1519480 RepID=UPI0006ADB68E|nr:hypothetical protein [Streptomyces sp. XY511]KOV14069.1 hypothetical protein ADK91_08135 [Streptomyces sp. XY511]